MSQEELLTVYHGREMFYSEYEALIELEQFVKELKHDKHFSFFNKNKQGKYSIKVEDKRIVELRFNYFQLDKVPEQIIGLKNLKRLDLSANSLIDLTGLEKLLELKALYLNDNQINKNADQNIEVIRSIPNLRELEIDGKGLNEDQLDKLYFRF